MGNDSLCYTHEHYRQMEPVIKGFRLSLLWHGFFDLYKLKISLITTAIITVSRSLQENTSCNNKTIILASFQVKNIGHYALVKSQDKLKLYCKVFNLNY